MKSKSLKLEYAKKINLWADISDVFIPLGFELNFYL